MSGPTFTRSDNGDPRTVEGQVLAANIRAVAGPGFAQEAGSLVRAVEDAARAAALSVEPGEWGDQTSAYEFPSPEPTPGLREAGIVQQAHVPCCWCGEHHEDGA